MADLPTGRCGGGAALLKRSGWKAGFQIVRFLPLEGAKTAICVEGMGLRTGNYRFSASFCSCRTAGRRKATAGKVCRMRRSRFFAAWKVRRRRQARFCPARKGRKVRRVTNCAAGRGRDVRRRLIGCGKTSPRGAVGCGIRRFFPRIGATPSGLACYWDSVPG